jgi:SAM-dependent methyltransferase
MRLEPAGLFLLDGLEPLTPPRFDELLAQGATFALTVDYRGLPPPIEELDRVRLGVRPRAAVPAGALVLRRDGDGFVFARVAPAGDVSERVALVERVERPGAVHRLDAPAWRLLGRLLAGAPRLEGAVARARAVAARLRRPLPVPVSLGDPDRLASGVAAKYAAAPEVHHQRALAREGLTPEEGVLFARALPPAARVLVVGCGAGREALALAGRGHRVVGLDPVAPLVEEARRLATTLGVQARFIAAAADAPGAPPGPFDAVVCARAVYAHTPTRRRRVALLGALARRLAPGGVLVLDAGWTPTRGPRLALVDGLRRLCRALLGDRFPTEPGDRLVRHLSLGSDASRACFYHVFRSADEIRRELEAAGLTGACSEEGPWIARARR